MDLMDLLSKLVPLPIVAFVLGVTEASKRWLATEIADAKTGEMVSKLPKWFLFIPIGLGLAAGVIHFYTTTPPEALTVMRTAQHVITAIEMGLGYAGAAVLFYEFKDRFFKKKDGTGG